ncbi:MAG: PHP domain-containing protein [Phycisphaeraceae bacterium]|nr:PHP domain-containing protein [Phycisphaeraceae bacterium]
MPAANQNLAAIFQQMADITEILGGDRFRVLSFQKAARLLDELPNDLTDPDTSKLSKLPGIGKGAAERIAEYLTTGKIQEHQTLLAQIPPRLLELLELQGVGPKTVALLWNTAHVTCLDDLRQQLQTNTLPPLPGFGEKKLANLRQALAFLDQVGGDDRRLRIGQAMPLARWIINQLRQQLGDSLSDLQYAGSLRRGKETIGDLDLLASMLSPKAQALPGLGPDNDSDLDPNDQLTETITTAFTSLPLVDAVLAQGPTKSAVRLNADGHHLRVDLRLVPPESFGAALLYFTGSKDHNVRLRERAIARHLKLNEYGLFRGEKRIAGRIEQEIFQALDLDFIPPELREDHGEIGLSERHTLPDLIDLDDLRAELHAHTNASDGSWSIAELAQYCADRRMHTLAVTDHSKSQFQAHGLSEERLEKHIQAIRDVAHRFKNMTLLAGAEVDILADGKLDYPDSLLKELDIVVASPHAALTQDSSKATSRLLRAIDNRYVTILGHPTGRLILRRPGLSPDIETIAQAAAERGIALEINANSHRLDLRDSHARIALDAGCKLAINTDAHGPADLDQLFYGLQTARRAGATKKDVVNALSRDALLKWIRSTRP